MPVKILKVKRKTTARPIMTTMRNPMTINLLDWLASKSKLRSKKKPEKSSSPGKYPNKKFS